MHQAVLLAGFAAIAAASPAGQGIDFASVNAAPSPSLTGPPVSANTQSFEYNSASVSAQGSAAATGVASATATASQALNSKRTFWPGWPWGWGGEPQPSPSKSQGWGSQPTSSSKSQPWGGQPTTSKPSVPPTTTSSESGSTGTATTSSETSCPTEPEPGTYCGFINPEDPCAVQPDGYGPHVEPDTVEAFIAYEPFHEEAKNAKAPAGYVETFVDINSQVQGNTYLGLQTLHSYDVEGCSQYCDNTTLCTGFNMFIERDPSLNPSENCTQPASITNYKCTLWGSSVDTASATDSGQYRGQFQVVITGSDGFEKTNTTAPAQCPGWQPPQQCGDNGSHGYNHPSTCIGTGFFPGPYNPLLCAAYAEAQNAINVKSSLWQQWINFFTGGNYNPLKCDFFNAYMLKKNGHALGTYCGLYAQQYGPGDASYTPGWQGSDHWSIESSWSFSIEGEGW